MSEAKHTFLSLLNYHVAYVTGWQPSGLPMLGSLAMVCHQCLPQGYDEDDYLRPLQPFSLREAGRLPQAQGWSNGLLGDFETAVIRALGLDLV